MKIQIKILSSLILLLFLSGCARQANYVGIWRSGTGSNVPSRFNTWQDFVDDGIIKTHEQGLRLIDFEFYIEDDKKFFVGIWRGGTGTNLISRFTTYQAFIADGEVKTHQQGLRLIDFEHYNDNGQDFYVGVWRNGTGNNIITNFSTWDAFVADGNDRAHNQGLRLIDFEYYKANGQEHYAGVWQSGTGSNVPSRFNTWDDFVADGNIKAQQQGLRLIDFEFFNRNGTENYLGIWRSGTGSNVPSRFETWEEFIADGNIKAQQQGLRLIDFEFFYTRKPVVIPPIDPPTEPTDPPLREVDCNELPKLPSYIELGSANSFDLEVDFTHIIDGKPRITLPVSFLPTLPICEGEYVFPENFCGFRILRADRFLWQTAQGEILGEDFHPVYNYIDEDDSLQDLEDEDYFNIGIEFTGPIGACANSNDAWEFPLPLTKTGGLSPDPSDPPVRLVIELHPALGEIQFLNYSLNIGGHLDRGKLFEEAEKKYIENVARTQATSNLLSGQSLEQFMEFVQEMCEENPIECPIGESEKWW